MDRYQRAGLLNEVEFHEHVRAIGRIQDDASSGANRSSRWYPQALDHYSNQQQAAAVEIERVRHGVQPRQGQSRNGR
jgi:hypothetical protein